MGHSPRSLFSWVFLRKRIIGRSADLLLRCCGLSPRNTQSIPSAPNLAPKQNLSLPAQSSISSATPDGTVFTRNFLRVVFSPPKNSLLHTVQSGEMRVFPEQLSISSATPDGTVFTRNFLRVVFSPPKNSLLHTVQSGEMRVFPEQLSISSATPVVTGEKIP